LDLQAVFVPPLHLKPGGQGTHVAQPASDHQPGAQTTGVEPKGHSDPAGHEVHDVAPAVLYFPAGQAKGAALVVAQ